ncbi:plant expansin [Flammula alnicola]|nr:plant expansin [Flammula alnicola]
MSLHKRLISAISLAIAASALTAPILPRQSFLQGTQTGEGTFYDTGLGACGVDIQNSDLAVAVSHLLFDNYPGYNGINQNDNPVCGKILTASYQGKNVTVQVLDRMPFGQVTDLDFSPGAFETLASLDVGRIEMTWVWGG